MEIKKGAPQQEKTFNFCYFLPHIFEYVRKIIHSVGSFFSFCCSLFLPKIVIFEKSCLGSAARKKISQAVGPSSNLYQVIHF